MISQFNAGCFLCLNLADGTTPLQEGRVEPSPEKQKWVSHQLEAEILPDLLSQHGLVSEAALEDFLILDSFLFLFLSLNVF